MIIRSILLLLGLLLSQQVVRINGQTVPQCFRDAVSTGNIECTNTDLTSVNANTLSTIAGLDISQVRKVFLTNCTMSDLSFLNTEYVGSLQFLNLENNRGLASGHLAALVPYVSRLIQDLTIKNNAGLRSIDQLLPSTTDNGAWKNLNKLRVTKQSLSTVNRQMFKQMNVVEELDLSDNRLEALDFSLHNNVGVLKKIMLNENLLARLDGLQEFTGLQELDLAYNALTDVSNFANAQLQTGNLKVLDLSNNKLTSFNLIESTGAAASTLDLNLKDNEITTIANLGISAARDVQEIDLSGNKELVVEEETFSGLSKLKILQLNDCGLKKITTHMQNLPELHTLGLARNSIDEISVDAFIQTKKLSVLQLQDNDLAEVDFLTSNEEEQPELMDLDLSNNQLENLKNFVSTPKLYKLKIDGSNQKNTFRELSSCNVFNELPQTLRIVCARSILESTLKSCQFRTFLDLLKASNNIIFNNDVCCDRACDAGPNTASSYPEAITCPTREIVCDGSPVNPGGTERPPNPGTPDGSKGNELTTERPEFRRLHDSEIIVMAVGYLLAFIFLIMVIILIMRRYRSYDKWLEDYRSTGHEMANMHSHTRRSHDTLDSVDGKLTKRGSPNMSMGTLSRGLPAANKSLDNISMVSGFSQYSASGAGKSTFQGRKKFNYTGSIDLDRPENGTRYVNPSTSANSTPRKRLQSNASAEDSPTAMSVYSYASHSHAGRGRAGSERDTPPMERRRHRSGGAPTRLKSTDLLGFVDEDLVPPQVQVVLQRKATEKRNSTGASPICRNTRPYGTAPYRTKGKGGVKKRGQSPLLAVNRIHRISKTPPSSKRMSDRALPDLPNDSLGGSVQSSQKSLSSIGSSNNSKLSNTSFTKNNSVFVMDEDEEPEYHQTYAETDQLDTSLG